MTIAILIGLIGVWLTSLTTLGAVAYSYGRLRQQVNGVAMRVDRLERIQDSEDADRRRATEELRNERRRKPA